MLLHNYIKALNTTDKKMELTNILYNGTDFANTSQLYQHVVSHDLSSKMETWMGLFMKPTHDVEYGLLTNEFTQGRGAIHFHSILYVLRNYLNVIRTCDNEEDDSNTTMIRIQYEDDTHVSTTSRTDV